MKVTVIGCWGGYPAAKEASSGYLLEHDGYKILMDCGSGVLSHLQTYINPKELNAVFISHFHPDHDADIGVYQHALLIDHMMGNEPVTVPIYSHAEDKPAAEKLNYKIYTKWMPVYEEKTIEVGPFKVTAMKTNHSVPCYAYRFEADGKVFAYTGDTSFKPGLIPFFRNANVLLSECNFYEGMGAAERAGHLTSVQAAKIAVESQVDKLVLTHLPHFGQLDDLVTQAEQIFDKEVCLAKAGLTINV